MNKALVKAYAAKLSDEWGYRVTASAAEAEIVRVIQLVARNLAPQFRFGYHTTEDMEQQGVLFGVEVLDRDVYDVNRPLENFLHVHIHNQLYNFKRKQYMRLEPPCKCCDPFSPPTYPCQKWLDWSKRNTAKQNLMRPLDMSSISDETEMNMRECEEIHEDVVVSELRTLLDRELPVELRRDYLKMLDGRVIPKSRREKVREAVAEIARKGGFFNDYEEK